MVAPKFRAVATPLIVMDATFVFDEVQATVFVMFCVVESENVPIAVNCCRVPSGMDGFTGVTAIESKTALVIVKVVLPETPPETAVTVQIPGVTPKARPCAPFRLMFTMVVSLVDHCTAAVTFCTLESLNVPMAWNCTAVPDAMDGLAGETASAVRAAASTVRVALPLTPENVAVIITVPGVFVLVMPPLGDAATLVFEDVQVADWVKSWLLPSLYLPVAVNCRETPAATDAVPGLTWIDFRTGGGLPTGVEVPLPPQPAKTPRHTTPTSTGSSFISSFRAYGLAIELGEEQLENRSCRTTAKFGGIQHFAGCWDCETSLKIRSVRKRVRHLYCASIFTGRMKPGQLKG